MPDTVDSLDVCKQMCLSDASCNGCVYNCDLERYHKITQCTETNSTCGSVIYYKNSNKIFISK